MSNILLSGYYGYNNAGDEAILKSIIQNIRAIDKDAKITVLSDNIAFTKEKYGINAVKRFNPFCIISALLSYDVLISGGGTLFQDKTSTRSLIYYTSIINMAKMLGKKVMIYANGIGPLKNGANIARVKRSIERADLVTLRDKEAMELVESMEVKNKKIFMTTDPVFCLNPADDEVIDKILRENEIESNREMVIVAVRSWEKQGEFTDIFANVCDYIIETYAKNVVFIVMQQPHDKVATKIIMSKMKNESYIIDNITPIDMMGLMRRAKYVLSMRLHGLIFSSSVGTPVLGFSYDPKIENILRQVDMPCVGTIEDMSFDEMKKAVDDIEVNINSYHEKLTQNIIEIKTMARSNFDYMKQIIEM